MGFRPNGDDLMRKASVGIQQLIERTCGPTVKGTVVVDQVYAQDQHESLDYIHPHGGGAKYLENPLMENTPGRIGEFAERFLNARRSTATMWGGVVCQPVIKDVEEHAPRKQQDLRFSAGLTVREGTGVVLVVPPKVPRLTEPALEVKDDTRPDQEHTRGGML